VAFDYRQHLAGLSFQPKDGPESPAAIAELERQVGVPLLADYRAFLLEVGGGYINAYAPCTVLTPFGRLHSVTELHGVQDVIGLLDSTITPRNMVCVGIGHNAATTCLSVAGLDRGQVFALDAKMRYYWGEETLANLPDLAPEIREFFRLRDAEQPGHLGVGPRMQGELALHEVQQLLVPLVERDGGAVLALAELGDGAGVGADGV